MSINLKIISSKSGDVFREKCSSILFTSQSGEVEVLAGHIPIIANIAENTNIIIKNEHGSETSFFTPSTGFFTFNSNECLITLISCTKNEALTPNNNQQKTKKAA